MRKPSHTDFTSEKSEIKDASSNHLRPGMICHRCRGAKIEYDGLLRLVCPICGLTESGAST